MGKTKYSTTRTTKTATTKTATTSDSSTRRASTKTTNREAILDLYSLYKEPSVKDRHGLSTLSGRTKIELASDQIFTTTTMDTRCDFSSPDHGRELLKQGRCQIRMASLDSKARSQRDVRVNGRKRHFRPYHITWLAKNMGGGAAMAQRAAKFFEDIMYIHRCHNGNCVEPEHGYWGTSRQNRSTEDCKSGSHLIRIGPKGRLSVFRLCPHQPVCLVPRFAKHSQFEPIPQ